MVQHTPTQVSLPDAREIVFATPLVDRWTFHFAVGGIALLLLAPLPIGLASRVAMLFG